jgi:hypothetical protein
MLSQRGSINAYLSAAVLVAIWLAFNRRLPWRRLVEEHWNVKVGGRLFLQSCNGHLGNTLKNLSTRCTCCYLLQEPSLWLISFHLSFILWHGCGAQV